MTNAASTGDLAPDVAGNVTVADPSRVIADEALRILARAQAVVKSADTLVGAALDLHITIERFRQGIDPPGEPRR